MERKDAKARPTKRVLVRWSDDLDKQVLLNIQYACSEEGVRIPWKKVAELMGAEFSEGAIIQHLAKLRHKMISAQMSVPPPLKRGTANQIPSKLYATGNKRKSAVPSTPGNATASTTAKNSPKKAKAKTKKMKYEEEEEEEPEDEDSDGEYGVPAKKRHTRLVASKTKPDTSKTGFFKEEAGSQSPARQETPAIKAESVQTDEGITSSIESPLSSVQTRGIRHDYKQYDENENEDSEGYDEPHEENEIYFEEANTNDKDDEDGSTIKEEGEVSQRTMVNPSATSVPGSATSASMVAQFGSNYNMMPPAPYPSQPYLNQTYQQLPLDRAFMPPASTNSSFSTSRNNSTGSLVPSMAGMQDAHLAGGGYGQMGNLMMGLGDQYNHWPGVNENMGSVFDSSTLGMPGDFGSDFVGDHTWADFGYDFGP